MCRPIGPVAPAATRRLLLPSEFDGPVTPGQDYYLVDDHVTLGGTLAALKSYIESKGGNVVGASSLTASRRGGIDSAVFAPTSQTQAALAEKFPQLPQWYKETTGNDVANLTNRESQYLLKFKTFDALRDRILAARDEIGSGVHAGAPGDEDYGELGPEPGDGGPGTHGQSGPGAPDGNLGGAGGVAAPRAFDLAGEAENAPGANLTVAPALRQQAQRYIATDKDADSPIELHLDHAAADPVGVVAAIAQSFPKLDVKPVDVTRMNAYSLNLSPDEVMEAIRPKFASDEMYDAAAMAVRSAGAQFWKAAQRAIAPDAGAADMENAVRAYALTNKFVGAVRDAKTDWGRAAERSLARQA